MVLLAIYDDNADGRGDRDEVVVTGLSIDNNLFLHGLTVDRAGNVYLIEDASGEFDGTAGNGGSPRIDAFPDAGLNGFLGNGKIFFQAMMQTPRVCPASLSALCRPIRSMTRSFLCANTIWISSIASQTRVGRATGPANSLDVMLTTLHQGAAHNRIRRLLY